MTMLALTVTTALLLGIGMVIGGWRPWGGYRRRR